MENNFIRINFAESKIPIFKENKSKGFLTYGEDNAYPQMLINLYNSSPKHGAIVTQKAAYIANIYQYEVHKRSYGIVLAQYIIDLHQWR